jgi:hypothetical protein
MPANWPLDPAAVYAHTTKLTGQLASLGATTILTAPPPDMYFVDIYLECPFAGSAGTVLATLAYTDNAGAATQVTSALVLTGLGRLSTRVAIVVASGNVSFTTTVAGAIGSPTYNIAARAERAISTV